MVNAGEISVVVDRSIMEKRSDKTAGHKEHGSVDYSSVIHEKAVLKASAKSSTEGDTKSYETR